MSSPERASPPRVAPLTAGLTAVRDPARSDWASAWVGLEPTFTDKKVVKLWERLAGDAAGQARFFTHKYLLGREKAVAKGILGSYRQAQQQQAPWCLFDRLGRREKLDDWQVPCQDLGFRCHGDDSPHHALHLRIGMEPATLKYRIQPVPLSWLYDARFVRLLQELVWDVPQALGLYPTMNGGGGQFSLSAKTYLGGSLLCDDLADKFNHPELACWTLDFPNANHRSFRATRARRAAFAQVIEQYWAGAFHPHAIGTLRVENALLDRGFLPASAPPEGLMTKETAVAGPIGSLQEVFQTNFAFGRGVRLLAQNVHPGYWQSAHPDSIAYRPDQIMRYGEGNLHRLQIVGELPTKNRRPPNPARIAEFDASLDQDFLDDEASWENRAQCCRTSAQDFVEAILLEVHRAQYLQRHPSVQPKDSLLQDQLLADADETILRHGGGARLDKLRLKARALNLDDSHGRIKSDFIEPETLFWETWHILSPGERSSIAREVVSNFRARVLEAATCDPRQQVAEGEPASADPMAWHRHRIHPILWQAIADDALTHSDRDPVLRELRQFHEQKDLYLSRRPAFDVHNRPPPWEKPPSAED